MTANPADGGGSRARPAAVSVIPREARPFQGQRAGVVSRVLANTVDFLVVVVAVGGGVLVALAVLFLWNPRGFDAPRLPWALFLTAGTAFSVGYLVVSWVTSGRTYGDRLVGLRVVNHRGDRLRLSGAALRALLCVFFPIGVLWVAVSPANRSVADICLRTSVVYDWSPPARPEPGAGR